MPSGPFLIVQQTIAPEHILRRYHCIRQPERSALTGRASPLRGSDGFYALSRVLYSAACIFHALPDFSSPPMMAGTDPAKIRRTRHAWTRHARLRYRQYGSPPLLLFISRLPPQPLLLPELQVKGLQLLRLQSHRAMGGAAEPYLPQRRLAAHHFHHAPPSVALFQQQLAPAQCAVPGTHPRHAMVGPQTGC